MPVCPSPVLIQAALETLLSTLGIVILDASEFGDSYYSNPLKDNQIQLIDEVVDALNTVQKTIVKGIQTRIANLGKHRNHIASPLISLPDELLLHMIVPSLEWIRRGDRPDRLDTLRTVCTSWAGRLLHCNHLWTEISSPLHPRPRTLPRMMQLLERSGSAPLDINIQCGDAAVLNAIIPHAGRWGTLEAQGSLLEIPQILEIPVPRLERLTIEGFVQPEPTSNALTRPVFAAFAPRLRSIRCSYLAVWEALEPETLNSITDAAFQYEYEIRRDDPTVYGRIIAIVSHFRMISSLSITFRGDVRTLPHSLINPVTLPTLRSYTVKSPASLLEPLFRIIQGPECPCYMAIDNGWDDPSTFDITPLLRAFSPSWRRAEPPVHTTIQVEGGTHYSRALAWVEFVCGESRIAIGRCSAAKAFQLVADASSAIEITRLTISAPAPPSDYFLLWASGTAEIPLPVEEVTFKPQWDGAFKIQDVAEFIRSRQSSSRELRRLECWEEGRWVDRLQAVKDINIVASRLA